MTHIISYYVDYYFTGLAAELKDFAKQYELKKYAPIIIAAFLAGFSQTGKLPDLSSVTAVVAGEERVAASLPVDLAFVRDALQQHIYNY